MAFTYFLAALLPVLGLLNHFFLRYSYVGDHFQYLASIGPLALGGAALWRVLEFFGGNNPSLRLVASGLLLGVLGTLSWQHACVFRDDETLWRDTVAKNPASWLALDNLGVALDEKGGTDEAIRHWQEAIRLKPDLAEAHYNLGAALAPKGQWAEAMVHYQQALAIRPGAILSLNNLAWLLATCPQAALRNGVKAVELARAAEGLSGGNDPNALDTLAAAYAEAGQFPEAVETAGRALALALAQNNPQVEGIRARLKLYQDGSPYHDPRPRGGALRP